MQPARAALLGMLLVVSGCGKEEQPAVYPSSAEGNARAELVAEALASKEFAKACEETPGCADPPRFDAPAGSELIWRVLVIREASGAVRIGRIDAVEVPRDDGVPVGPLSGSHLLVGLDGSGQPVDGQLIRFPDKSRVEYQPVGPAPDVKDSGEPARPRSPAEEVDLTGREVSTVGFVRALPAIKTIAIRDESGATVSQSVLPALTAQAQSNRGLWLINAALAQQPGWPYEGNIPPYCAHVLILEGEMDRPLAQGIAYEDEIIELVVPGPNQRATIFAALRRMTPLLCQGIRRIALGVVPSRSDLLGVVRVVSTGDMMLINVFQRYSETSLGRSLFQRIDMMATIFHEAAHSTEALISVQGSVPEAFAGDWILPARTMAANTIKRVRIEKGLRSEWWRVQESFQMLDWASAYPTSEGAKQAVYVWSPSEISDGGFMSHYGATSVHDDIAEMVAGVYVTGGYLKYGWAGPRPVDLACREMRSHSDRSLPSRFAAVYTKVMFLKDLGMVAEEDVKTCMGPDIGLPVDAGGFHFWHDGNMLRSFDRNLTAKIGTNDAGEWVFEMKAEGEASFSQKMYPAKLELRLGVDETDKPEHRVAWPRGVYKLELLGNNTARVRLDGAPAGDFNVTDGYVLVAEASNERIAGSIFVTLAMRLGVVPPVPQTWNPPLVIRFLIEH